MKIGSYVMEYGVRYPESVRNYVRSRVQTLARLIANELGEGYTVFAKGSKKSEANYVKITNTNTNITYEVSFRNHGNFGTTADYDRAIMLCRYASWTECKNEFMSSILPDIQRIIDIERPFERDFERELDRRIGELLMKEAGLL